jgi:predicted DNA binding CopG/RHH family protein
MAIMTSEPRVGRFIDDDEAVLAATLERDDFSATGDALTPARFQGLQAAARATINDEREKISLRIPRRDLSRLKSRAMEEGIPYQTLINALIHKYVAG